MINTVSAWLLKQQQSVKGRTQLVFSLTWRSWHGRDTRPRAAAATPDCPCCSRPTRSMPHLAGHKYKKELAILRRTCPGVGGGGARTGVPPPLLTAPANGFGHITHFLATTENCYRKIYYNTVLVLPIRIIEKLNLPKKWLVITDGR